MAQKETTETKPKLQLTVTRGRKPFSLIIIGGGPAGLTAGIYARRADLDVLLIERAIPGGLITSTDRVENYPGFPEGISGMELGQKFEEQAKVYGLDIVYGKVIKLSIKDPIKEILTEEDTFSARSVIIATGSDHKKLDIPGEERFTGKGVSYCATCDGPFYKDKNVAIIGGGNAALEEALFLTKFAKLVTIIHRREKLRADKVLQDKAAANPKIFIKLHSVAEEIQGDNKVRSIKLKDTLSDKPSLMDIDGVFIYAGLSPNTAFVKDMIKLGDDGSIITDDMLSTNIPGIFAAGDVRRKSLRQVVTAVSDGALAANSAKEYLGE